MTGHKQKLELTWIGKEKRPLLEPRILMPDDALSHLAGARVGAGDRFDNLLIQGDNLLALKALEAEFAGQVKCIYIDPPYNTGSAFEHYDDGVEHSVWLTLVRDRLEQLSALLREDGSIWVSIDDREMAYLKILLDEVFGRRNFVANVVWRRNYSPKSSAEHFSDDQDYILLYARDIDTLGINGLARTAEQDAAYKNPDNDPRGPWKPGDLSARNPYSLGIYAIRTPSGREIAGPPPGTYWRVSQARLRELDSDKRIWWGRDGSNVPAIKRFLTEVKQFRVPQTFWDYKEVGHTQEAKKESVALFGEDAFGTPKPERLIERILQIATDPGDLVLDSFAGSGTTGAVAHKMGRRWIMVEQGDHAVTHIVPRLKKVIDGADPGGVTEATGWKGGGGFRFFRLAPSLLEKDQFGNWVISKKYDPTMLAQAICKHEGFTYAPSTQHYWMHGFSSERDFIYVTTQALPYDQLKALSDAVGPERSLLVCCKAFQGEHVARLKNLTVKKIPLAILHRCEWGKDDYSQGVAALAPVEPEPAVNGHAEPEPEEPPRPRRGRKKKAAPPPEATLFDDAEGEV